MEMQELYLLGALAAASWVAWMIYMPHDHVD